MNDLFLRELAMSYEVACSCGKVLLVSEGMAGSLTSCSCGRAVDIPSMDELKRQADKESPGELSPAAKLQLESSSDDSVSPSEADSPQARLAEFQRTLVGLTPRVYITPVLIGANVLLFILMIVTGVSPFEPTIPDLVR